MMTRKGRITQYREHLDKTLASHDLTDEVALKDLVKNQILLSSSQEEQKQQEAQQHVEAENVNIDNVTRKRTSELSNILGMLRSASEHQEETSPEQQQQQNNSWKLKQDSEELRVMYREGPLGSPFHTLLCEGYVDAPLDACLCISLEASLYPIWFPETRIPTFRIAQAECLQKIRIGEQISLVRVKLSWPLSDREALMHFFEFEYLKEGLIIVIQSTFDVESIQKEVDGFSKDDIPEVGQTVRVDLVGGFALQKVSKKRTFFRTIVNMDIKLDLIPPYLINFISRQLVGGAFKLYKKTLTSVSKDNGNFVEPMKDPLYTRIRKTLYPESEEQNNKTDNNNPDAEDSINTSYKEVEEAQGNKETTNTSSVCTSEDSTPPLLAEKASTEIEEEVEGTTTISPHESELIVEDTEETETSIITTDQAADKSVAELCTEKHQFESNDQMKPTALISPRVEQALDTLDQMISVIREKRKEGGHHANAAAAASKSRSPTPNGDVESSKLGSKENWTAGVCTNERQSPTGSPLTVADSNGKGHCSPINGLNSHDSMNQSRLTESLTSFPNKEVNLNRIAPVSPEPKFLSANESPQVGSHLEVNGNGNAAAESIIVIPSVANGTAENVSSGIPTVEVKKTEQKKWRVCCLSLIPERLISSSSS